MSCDLQICLIFFLVFALVFASTTATATATATATSNLFIAAKLPTVIAFSFLLFVLFISALIIIAVHLHALIDFFTYTCIFIYLTVKKTRDIRKYKEMKQYVCVL